MYFESDKERIEGWDDFCVSKKWMVHGDIKKGLKYREVKFTGAGSVAAPEGLAFRVTSEKQAAELISLADDYMVASNTLSVYTGHVIFKSSLIESSFWAALLDKKVPKEFVPEYIIDILNNSEIDK